MSVQKAKELVQLMSTDEAFRASVVAAPDRAAKHSLLAARGFADVAPTDLEAITPRAGDELSEEELLAVAGGQTAAWVLVSLAAIALAL